MLAWRADLGCAQGPTACTKSPLPSLNLSSAVQVEAAHYFSLHKHTETISTRPQRVHGFFPPNQAIYFASYVCVLRGDAFRDG